MNIRIKRLHASAVIPQYAHDTDSGFDLVATEDVIVRPGETVRVPTGLAFEIPPGTELQIRPRSGITSKTKLRVQLGTVDSSYRGEVAVMVDNIDQGAFYVNDSGEILFPCHSLVLGIDGATVWDYIEQEPDGTYIIRRGDRIAQGVIAPVVHAAFEEVDELGETERGSGAFGSTGV